MSRRLKSAKSNTRTKKQKPNVGAHRLNYLSLKFLQSNTKLIGRVVLVAVAVHFIIGLVFAAEVKSVYQSLWFVFTSCALVWSIRQAQFSGRKSQATVAEAYWEGAAPALKLLVILGLLTVAIMPFTLGVYIFSTVNYLALDSLVADIIAVMAWAGLGFASLLFMSRLVLSAFIVTLPQIGPGRAIATSWDLSRGKTLTIAKYLAVIFAYIFMGVVLLTVGLSLLNLSPAFIQSTLEVLSFGVLVPVIYVYAYMLYKQLA